MHVSSKRRLPCYFVQVHVARLFYSQSDLGVNLTLKQALALAELG